MQIVCNETFENHVERYLTSSDKILVEIKEKYLDQAFKGATYILSTVEVDCGSIKELDPINKTFGDSVVYSKPGSHHFEKTVTYTFGTELMETVTSGWSVTGGLSAKYQGASASTGVTYTKKQSDTMKKIRGMTESATVQQDILVKPNCSVRASVIRTIQRKECQVRNLELHFPRDTKLKCKFTKVGSTKVQKKPYFLVREILNDCIKNKGADTLIAKLEGKCVWIDVDMEVKVEPLHE